jgi:hypothetical protein
MFFFTCAFLIFHENFSNNFGLTIFLSFPKGDLICVGEDRRIIPFSDALLNSNYKSVYNHQTRTIAVFSGSEGGGESRSVIQVDINQAVRTSKLPPDFCLVYDTDLSRQVSKNKRV